MATWRARCWRTSSTPRSGCCTRWCRSLPKRSGSASPRAHQLFSEEAQVIGQMARARVGTDREASDGGAGGAAVHSLLSDGSQLTVPLAGVVDIEKECARLGGELDRLESQL